MYNYPLYLKHGFTITRVLSSTSIFTHFHSQSSILVNFRQGIHFASGFSNSIRNGSGTHCRSSTGSFTKNYDYYTNGITYLKCGRKLNYMYNRTIITTATLTSKRELGTVEVQDKKAKNMKRYSKTSTSSSSKEDKKPKNETSEYTKRKEDKKTKNETLENNSVVQKLKPIEIDGSDPKEFVKQNVKQSKGTLLKQAVRDYGATVIVFHVTLSLTSLGFFYLLVSSGLDVVAILSWIGFDNSILESKFTQEGSKFVLAYAVHKIFAPGRIAVTLAATPLIVRKLRAIGFLKKPSP